MILLLKSEDYILILLFLTIIIKKNLFVLPAKSNFTQIREKAHLDAVPGTNYDRRDKEKGGFYGSETA